MQLERVLWSLWSPLSSGDKNTASSERQEIVLTSQNITFNNYEQDQNNCPKCLRLWCVWQTGSNSLAVSPLLSEGCPLSASLSYSKLNTKCVMRRDCRLLRPQRFYSAAQLHLWEQLKHYRPALRVFSAAGKRGGRTEAKWQMSFAQSSHFKTRADLYLHLRVKYLTAPPVMTCRFNDWMWKVFQPLCTSLRHNIFINRSSS